RAERGDCERLGEETFAREACTASPLLQLLGGAIRSRSQRLCAGGGGRGRGRGGDGENERTGPREHTLLLSQGGTPVRWREQESTVGFRVDANLPPRENAPRGGTDRASQQRCNRRRDHECDIAAASSSCRHEASSPRRRRARRL